MKNFILLVILSFTAQLAIAQAPSWQWASGGGERKYDIMKRILPDGQGHLYVLGVFSDTTVVIGGFTLTSSSPGYNDIFIAKLDTNGKYQWIKTFKGNQSDIPLDMTLDGKGHLYVTGTYYSNSITFDTITLHNSTTTLGPDDYFVVKYDTAGNALWARSATGQLNEVGYGVAVDNQGNVIVAGAFRGTVTFGSTTFIASVNYTDIFLVKYDSSGNIIWVKSVGGGSYDGAEDVATDANGNIYMTGRFSSNIKFGTISLNGKGGEDIFITRYSPSGVVQWAKSAGGIAYDNSYGIKMDGYGGLYVTGLFEGSTFLLDTTHLYETFALAGTSDMFLARYDTAGNLLWAKNAKGVQRDNANDLAVDTQGNAYVTGAYQSTVFKLDNDSLLCMDTASFYKNNVYVAKFDLTGKVAWLKGVSTLDYEEGLSVGVDVSGSVYVGGDFLGPALPFGKDTVFSHYPGIFNPNFFLAKLSYDIATPLTGEPHAVNTILVYPNPSSGTFTLSIAEHAGVNLTIHNLLGAEVYTAEISSSNTVVDLRHQSPGIYFYRLTNSAGGLTSGKVIIE